MKTLVRVLPRPWQRAAVVSLAAMLLASAAVVAFGRLRPGVSEVALDSYTPFALVGANDEDLPPMFSPTSTRNFASSAVTSIARPRFSSALAGSRSMARPPACL